MSKLTGVEVVVEISSTDVEDRSFESFFTESGVVLWLGLGVVAAVEGERGLADDVELFDWYW